MNTTTPSDLAIDLATARRDHTQIDATPFASLDAESDAYQLQHAAISAYDAKCIGYKVGATSAAAQKVFQCDGPFFGPMFDREYYDVGTVLPCYTGVLGGEAEFAFQCGADFPEDPALAAADLPGLVSACHMAVELVGRRTVGEGLPPLLTAIADFGANIAFMPGGKITDWAEQDLSKVQVSATVDGEETNRGTGADVMGNPLNSLLWLHTALLSQGKSLKQGDWVSSGTCLGAIAARPGTTVQIQFHGIGEIGYQLV